MTTQQVIIKQNSKAGKDNNHQSQNGRWPIWKILRSIAGISGLIYYVAIPFIRITVAFIWSPLWHAVNMYWLGQV